MTKQEIEQIVSKLKAYVDEQFAGYGQEEIECVSFEREYMRRLADDMPVRQGLFRLFLRNLNSMLKRASVEVDASPNAITALVDGKLADSGLSVDGKGNVLYKGQEIGGVGKPGSGESSEVFNDMENNQAAGDCAHAEGGKTKATGAYSHAEGYLSEAIADTSHVEGYQNKSYGHSGHAEGYKVQADGAASHAEGGETLSAGERSHSEGGSTKSYGYASHAEGGSSIAVGNNSHAEGHDTRSEGNNSHTEGGETVSRGAEGHAEGYRTNANGGASHAEGGETYAEGDRSHAEGNSTKASGYASHSEGGNTEAKGERSHAEGSWTVANNEGEHAEGAYNKSNTGGSDAQKTLHSVGIGTAENARKNAYEIMRNGDHYVYGIGGYNGTNPGTAKTLQEVVNEGGGSSVSVVQSTGQSTTAVMSQKAVTDELAKKAGTDTATQREAGLMSAADKKKLDGLSAQSPGGVVFRISDPDLFYQHFRDFVMMQEFAERMAVMEVTPASLQSYLATYQVPLVYTIYYDGYNAQVSSGNSSDLSDRSPDYIEQGRNVPLNPFKLGKVEVEIIFPPLADASTPYDNVLFQLRFKPTYYGDLGEVNGDDPILESGMTNSDAMIEEVAMLRVNVVDKLMYGTSVSKIIEYADV